MEQITSILAMLGFYYIGYSHGFCEGRLKEKDNAICLPKNGKFKVDVIKISEDEK